MRKSSLLLIASVLAVSGCAAPERSPEIKNCESIARDAIWKYWDAELMQIAFGLLQDVKVSDLKFDDLGNSKGRITGNFKLSFDPAREAGNDGYFVCAVDGASVTLEDWNMN